MVSTEKTHPKSRIMLHLRPFLRTGAKESTTKRAPSRNCSEEVGEEPGYIGVFAGGGGPENTWSNIKRLLHITNQPRHLKVITLVLFFLWEDARVWAH